MSMHLTKLMGAATKFCRVHSVHVYTRVMHRKEPVGRIPTLKVREKVTLVVMDPEVPSVRAIEGVVLSLLAKVVHSVKVHSGGVDRREQVGRSSTRFET